MIGASMIPLYEHTKNPLLFPLYCPMRSAYMYTYLPFSANTTFSPEKLIQNMKCIHFVYWLNFTLLHKSSSPASSSWFNNTFLLHRLLSVCCCCYYCSYCFFFFFFFSCLYSVYTYFRVFFLSFTGETTVIACDLCEFCACVCVWVCSHFVLTHYIVVSIATHKPLRDGLRGKCQRIQTIFWILRQPQQQWRRRQRRQQQKYNNGTFRP